MILLPSFLHFLSSWNFSHVLLCSCVWLFF
jgi:hypothetical protein